MLTGVPLGDSRVAGQLPQVKNKAGSLHGHQVHSTVTALRTPVYSSAPKGILYIRIMVEREGGIRNPDKTSSEILI